MSAQDRFTTTKIQELSEDVEVIRIRANGPLAGTVSISGSKNAVLPILVASILTDEEMTVQNTPCLNDVSKTLELLRQMGLEVIIGENMNISLCSKNMNNFIAPDDVVNTMRASILALGPMVARHGQAQVALPGGCAIGSRPVDTHLEGLRKMGARVKIENGCIKAQAHRLHGAKITLSSASVTGTENLLMAASLAKGTTIVENAAREPEVVDLAKCLKKMGSDIEGEGTSRITIHGKNSLNGCAFKVLPDRIESGTYLIAAVMTRGRIRLIHARGDLLTRVLEKLEDCGAHINLGKDYIDLDMRGKRPSCVDIETKPYPGFPTDMQAQITSLNAIANGKGIIIENIFENRLQHIYELRSMGAKIQKINLNTIAVQGVSKLKGTHVMATDLRASASLILAGLVADNETFVSRIDHLDRGYEHIEEKLSKLGADICRIRMH